MATVRVTAGQLQCECKSSPRSFGHRSRDMSHRDSLQVMGYLSHCLTLQGYGPQWAGTIGQREHRSGGSPRLWPQAHHVPAWGLEPAP